MGSASESPDYCAEVRAEIAATLNATPPGDWAELALCPGPFGCPWDSEAEAAQVGGRLGLCDDCRVIHLYRPF